jgi:polysaccharide biosynthesis protein PslJ
MTRDLAVRAGVALLLVAAVVMSMGTGWLVTQQPWIGVAIAMAVLVIAIGTADPVALPLLAIPLLIFPWYLGAGQVEMTLSDWMLGIAFWPAVLLAPRPFSAELRGLLWVNAVYQAATLFTVVSNPYAANVIEWFHAWLLVSGALILGWAVGRTGHAGRGLSLLLIACLAVAVAVIVVGATQWSRGEFTPVQLTWPWFMHKNYVGSLLAVAAVIAYVRPPWLGWSRRWAWGAFWTMVVAIIMARSEQGLVGLALGVVVVVLRSRSGIRRSRLMLLLAVPALAIIYTVVREEYFSDNPHNSIRQRVEWLGDTLSLWQDAPLVGHGLRYWTEPDAPGGFQPPNAFLEVLASAGIVGVLAFGLLITATLVTVWRLDPLVGTVALGVTVTRLVQSQFDLFWVSVSVSVPFVVVGVCLGLAADQVAKRPPVVEPSRARVGSDR